ncbi:unnamed protein product [Linum tenue]|uniref:Uncharacterized protein n=1 Tax=Linum tenue TaxID=586396 RepID=A0AAV0NZN7_9ROSI|nr:unnamed protein product [Linum tenue]CAI0463971.1 unnamed protein product [Linum tenue]
MRVLLMVQNGRTMMPLSVEFLQPWWRMCTGKDQLLSGRHLSYYSLIFVHKLQAY